MGALEEGVLPGAATGREEPAAPAVDVRALGRPIKGPSALGSDPRRLWHLTWALARTEFKLRFFDSALGYLWQLMRPLLIFGVIYLVLSIHASTNKPGSSHSSSLVSATEQPHYAVALLLGVVLFTFFGEASNGAVASLVDRESLVRKVEFPRLAVPLACIITALMNICLNLIPVFIFLLAEGAAVQLSWLELPLLVLALAVFSTGLAMLLSVGFVRYRDVRPIWEVLLQATFYASGIFFVITGAKPLDILGVQVDISHVLLANPFAALLQQGKHALVSPQYPSAHSALGGGALILIPIGIALATLVIGYVVFDRQAPYVAERL